MFSKHKPTKKIIKVALTGKEYVVEVIRRKAEIVVSFGKDQSWSGVDYQKLLNEAEAYFATRENEKDVPPVERVKKSRTEKPKNDLSGV